MRLEERIREDTHEEYIYFLQPGKWLHTNEVLQFS